MRHDNDNIPLGTILTTVEVMARLRVSRKTLYILVSKHLANAARIGREYRFEERDIITIWNGMQSCGSTSGSERPVRATSSFGAPMPKAGKSTNLQRRLTKKRRMAS
ncbi:helix-turn-helix domain-containing protein [Rhodopseudomonas sp. P2A-2r]|uniref:helix-turn-helix domain-containing protein n=1 Tax=Rhodopseudomonas sp. P2A-2r TaxID=2991972 RepID=UPI0039B6FDBE